MSTFLMAVVTSGAEAGAKGPKGLVKVFSADPKDEDEATSAGRDPEESVGCILVGREACENDDIWESKAKCFWNF